MDLRVIGMESVDFVWLRIWTSLIGSEGVDLVWLRI